MKKKLDERLTNFRKPFLLVFLGMSSLVGTGFLIREFSKKGNLSTMNKNDKAAITTFTISILYAIATGLMLL